MLFLACAAPPPPPTPPDACTVMAAGTHVPDAPPLAVAKSWIGQARTSGDAGFYTMAEVALDCQLSRQPDDVDAKRLKAHVWIQFHRFADVENMASELVAQHGGSLDYALLGDAQMEQGKLDAAAEAYQAGVNLRPGIELYDRIGWLRWLWGDVEGALEMANLAVDAGTTDDPETFAWVLTRLGWMHAQRGEPYPEIQAALRLLPHYKPALYAAARIQLEENPDQAAAQLKEIGATVEARRSLREIEPATPLDDVKMQDPRGYAIAISDTAPAAALAILEEELKGRQDATTRMAHAYAGARVRSNDPRDVEEARAALATGIVEPRVLLQGGLVLQDPLLLARALASGPGLLPSERLQAQFARAAYLAHPPQ